MKIKNTLLFLAIVGLSISQLGCNEFQANSSGLNGGLSLTPGGQVPDGTVDMTALNKDLDVVDASVVEVDGQVDKLDSSVFAGVTTTTQQGLDKSLKQKFDKLYNAVAKAYSTTDLLKAEIQSQLLKLDPTNPLHMVAIVKLQDALKYLDELKVKIGETVTRIAVKVETTVAMIDSKIAKMDQQKPATWAVMILWSQMRTTVMDFHDRLLLLVGP